MDSVDEMGKPYGEMSDRLVDRLLLRYLLRVNGTQHRHVILAHLIADYGFSEPLDEPRHCIGIPFLVYEPGDGALGQQFLRYLLDFFECSVTIVGSGRCDHESGRVPGQTFASIRLLGVSINRRGSDVLFEPLQLGNKILDLLLDILRML